jgi:NitT/TauT family transport system substrate-binding protein
MSSRLRCGLKVAIGVCCLVVLGCESKESPSPVPNNSYGSAKPRSGADRRLRGSRPRLRLAGSHYVGWMPWYLAQEDGTLAENADDENLDVSFVSADYIESISLYLQGEVDAVVLTNVDAVLSLVRKGVESDVILVGSYSDGNDAILLRDPDGGVVRQSIGLVELSVSQYLLERYLEIEEIRPEQVEVINLDEAQLAAIFAGGENGIAGVVTWNPITDLIETKLRGHRLFDSRAIPGEIADLLVIRRSALREHPGFARVLLKTWFDITGRLSESATRQNAVAAMGRLSGTDQPGFERQMKTTRFLIDPVAARAEVEEDAWTARMRRVLEFAKRKELLMSYEQPKFCSVHGEAPALLHFNSEPLVQWIEANALSVDH